MTLWLSLGENCLPDGILKRHGLKSFNTPFSSGRSNIDYILACERARYAGLIDPTNLSYQDYFGTRVVRSTLYNKADGIFASEVSSGFEFTHHDLIADQGARESFERKIRRLQDIKSNGANTVFLYHHRSNGASCLRTLTRKLSAFQRLYSALPKQRCMIVLLHQNVLRDRADSTLHKDVVTPDILAYRIDTPHTWGGKDDFWALKDDALIAAMLDDARGALALTPAETLRLHSFQA